MKYLVALLISTLAWAQNDTLSSVKNHIEKMNSDSLNLKTKTILKPKNFIIPGVLIGYGVLAKETKLFNKINFDTRNEIREDHPTFGTKIDNFAQFAPGAAVYALNSFGVKGQSSLKKEAIVYAMSVGIITAIVIPTKKLIKEERPDGSNSQSFPSGHTAMAFASAEFLRREYGKKYPWIAVAGYTVATGTGLLRMYNNKHWLGDVAAGAGVGVLSTTLSYWLYEKLNIDKKKSNGSYTQIYPTISKNQYGLGFEYHF